MVLAIDMGNSLTEIGLIRGSEPVMSEMLSTDVRKTQIEYAVMLRTIFSLKKIREEEIGGAVISSVVPQLTPVMKNAVRLVTGLDALIVGPGVRNGLKIRIDDPRTLGADLVVNAVGGIALYGTPLIVIDMGTATTLSAIDRNGAFRGAVIMPGVRVSLQALVANTAQLPEISLDNPGQAIGTNTVDSMRSGIVYGQADQLDGMIRRIRAQMGADAAVVATGGLAGIIIPYCSSEIRLDPDLMIRGLKVIYDLNTR